MLEKIKNFFTSPKKAWLSFCFLLTLNLGGLYTFLHWPKNEDVSPNEAIPEIVGINKVAAGDLVQLSLKPYKESPDGLESYDVNWEVWDEGRKIHFIKTPDGIFFGSGYKSRKIEVLTGVSYLYKTKLNNVESWFVRSYILKTIVEIISPIPPPPPSPPPPPPPLVDPVFPNGEFGLSKWTWDHVKTDVISNKKGEVARALANNLATIAQMISSGTIKDSEVALAKTAEMSAETYAKLGESPNNWSLFSGNVQEKLYSIDETRVFSNDVKKLGIALLEISLALREVK